MRPALTCCQRDPAALVCLKPSRLMFMSPEPVIEPRKVQRDIEAETVELVASRTGQQARPPVKRRLWGGRMTRWSHGQIQTVAKPRWYCSTSNNGPNRTSARPVVVWLDCQWQCPAHFHSRVSHAYRRLLSARGALRRPKPPRAARRPQPRRLVGALAAATAARSAVPPKQHKRNMPLTSQLASGGTHDAHREERATQQRIYAIYAGDAQPQGGRPA